MGGDEMKYPLRLLVFSCIGLFCCICAKPDLSTSSPHEVDPRWNLPPAVAKKLVDRVQMGTDLTPTGWPDGKRVAVILTFDVDAELAWMTQPEETSLSALSRGRFGIRAGLPRILELLERKGIRATFFLPALIVELYPEAIDAIRAEADHEIGLHGYAHESIRSLSQSQERDALKRAVEIFRKADLMPRSYRSPSWDFTPSTATMLREFGFEFDSSLMADDRPHELLAGTTPTGIIEFPVDWSLDDWPYFQLEWATPWPGLREPNEVFEIWKEEFEGIRNHGGVLVLTMHPQVIGHWHRLRMLERLLDHMQANNDVWFATLSEIGDHIQRSRSQ